MSIRKKLKELLAKYGDCKTVECQIKRWKLKMKRLTKSGGWYTKLYLEKDAGWSKPVP